MRGNGDQRRPFRDNEGGVREGTGSDEVILPRPKAAPSRPAPLTAAPPVQPAPQLSNCEMPMPDRRRPPWLQFTSSALAFVAAVFAVMAVSRCEHHAVEQKAAQVKLDAVVGVMQERERYDVVSREAQKALLAKTGELFARLDALEKRIQASKHQE